MLLGLLAPLLTSVVKGTLGKVFREKGMEAHDGVMDSIIGSVVDGIKGDPQLNLELEELALEKAKIVLKYEGEASIVPNVIKVMRGLVRPGIVWSGWIIFMTIWLWSMFDYRVTFNPPHIVTEAWLGLTAFWFVGRNREKGLRW